MGKFTWARNTNERFECATGNPPFIRYQMFKGAVREAALKLCADIGAEFTGLTSSWAPFLAVTASLLKPGGRMGFVVPAEIGHAPYASPFLEYLVEKFSLVQVVAVRRKLFPDLSVASVCHLGVTLVFQLASSASNPAADHRCVCVRLINGGAPPSNKWPRRVRGETTRARALAPRPWHYVIPQKGDDYESSLLEFHDVRSWRRGIISPQQPNDARGSVPRGLCCPCRQLRAHFFRYLKSASISCRNNNPLLVDRCVSSVLVLSPPMISIATKNGDDEIRT
jgi:hypothetical protein